VGGHDLPRHDGGSPDAPAAAAFFIRRKSSASQQSGSFSGLK